MTNPERRELHFNSLNEVQAEVERLAAGEVRTVGNHSFSEIINHLAISQDVSAGRTQAPPPPFLMRLMRPLMRRMVINSKPLKPGIKLPAAGESFFWPQSDLDVPAAVRKFKDSTQNYLNSGPIENHPFFGKLSREESDSLNCRHAALHLSFVHPAE